MEWHKTTYIDIVNLACLFGTVRINWDLKNKTFSKFFLLTVAMELIRLRKYPQPHFFRKLLYCIMVWFIKDMGSIPVKFFSLLKFATTYNERYRVYKRT